MNRLVATFLIFFVGFSTCCQAGWKSSFRFSDFKNPSLSNLVNGKVLTERTPVNIPFAMAVETLFFVPKSPEHIAKGILKWNPTPHKSLGVLEHKQFGSPVKGGDFSGFKLNSKHKGQRWLIQQSTKARVKKTPLNVSKSEASRLSKTKGRASSAGSAWRGILQARAKAYQEKGVDGLAQYPKRKGIFRMGREVRRLISRLPKIKSQFSSLLGRVWKGSSPETTAEEGGASLVDSYYWEKIKVDSKTALVLGAIKAEKKGSCWQLADFQYYVSSDYFSSLVLYKVCPVKGGSVVWRGDYVLVPSIIYLRGVERIVSENLLLKEVKKAIGFLKRDLRR